ncbi:MAG TPA: RecB family exonuclease [Actinophytocola sp.]|uniref:RecB family exonuclease n=1 Tax=Actinophytocola sp. TaxID=1872138 RepID=UPI002DDCB80C|nr:RecB family exonuclease [Actinophytocola sp.]HEV2783383.1 RecB family exonuclease [Actinophytocola sp.]
MTDTALPLVSESTGSQEVPEPRRPALSPSRASDFKHCPLLYRFRAIDRLPETPSPAQVRGIVVHAVLEELFGLPAERRLPDVAHALVAPAWQRVREERPELAELFADANGQEVAEWLASAGELIDGYFRLEDPRLVAPEARELLVETELGSGVLLRGYIDRLDVAPTGELRVVDYKSGVAPREFNEAKALFQMKFYAVALWRLRGIVPRQLRLMYLADRQSLTYTPDEAELARFERTLEAIWQAILKAGRTGDFRANPGKLCEWCSHQERCPAFGNTPPDYPGWPEPDPGEESVVDRAD